MFTEKFSSIIQQLKITKNQTMIQLPENKHFLQTPDFLDILYQMCSWDTQTKTLTKIRFFFLLFVFFGIGKFTTISLPPFTFGTVDYTVASVLV